jgi:PPP family 3-phenylpropionic acid transporter
LWQQLGFEAMFVIAGIAFLPALFFASSLEEGRGEAGEQVKVSLWEIRHDIGLVILVVASFLVGATIHLSLVFDGIYMNYLGGTQVLVGLMFGVTAFSELPAMHYSLAFIRRLGGPATLLLACSLLMLAFVGYTLAWQAWMLLVTAMIKGLGFGLFWVSTIRLTNERTPESWASTVQSILTASSFGLAPLLASPLSGELYDRFGPKAVFVCGSLLVGGSTLIFLVAIFKRVFTDGTRVRTTTP